MVEFVMWWLLVSVAVVTVAYVLWWLFWLMEEAIQYTYQILSWVWHGTPLWKRDFHAEPLGTVAVAIVLLPLTLVFLLIGIPIRLHVGRPETFGEWAEKEIAAGRAHNVRGASW
jgi:hypothetical protein